MSAPARRPTSPHPFDLALTPIFSQSKKKTTTRFSPQSFVRSDHLPFRAIHVPLTKKKKKIITVNRMNTTDSTIIDSPMIQQHDPLLGTINRIRKKRNWKKQRQPTKNPRTESMRLRLCVYSITTVSNYVVHLNFGLFQSPCNHFSLSVSTKFLF